MITLLSYWDLDRCLVHNDNAYFKYKWVYQWIKINVTILLSKNQGPKGSYTYNSEIRQEWDSSIWIKNFYSASTKKEIKDQIKKGMKENGFKDQFWVEDILIEDSPFEDSTPDFDTPKELIRITLWDWSSDWHCHSSDYYFDSNYSNEELQEAYKNSCKIIGVQFNHTEDFTWKELWYWDEALIWTEYEDSWLSDFARESLRKAWIDEKYLVDYFSSDKAIDLLIEFLKISLPSLTLTVWKKSDEAKNFNWWWWDLNIWIWYWLYSD